MVAQEGRQPFHMLAMLQQGGALAAKACGTRFYLALTGQQFQLIAHGIDMLAPARFDAAQVGWHGLTREQGNAGQPLCQRRQFFQQCAYFAGIRLSLRLSLRLVRWGWRGRW